jgi:putative peptidoglycan lipid II flippase
VNPTTSRRLALAAVLVASGNVLSRLLGLIREPVIAALFGASGNADAFEVASRLPQLVHDLVIGGAVSGVLIPLFSELASDDQRLTRTFTALLTSVGLALLGVVGLMMLLAEPLVSLAAPGLPESTRATAVTMTRITMPGVVFLGVSAIAAARLYARDRFAAPSLAPATLNGTMIVLALSLTPVVGPTGVALGYLAGTAAHLLVHIPALIREGTRFSWPRWKENTDATRALRLYLPIAGGLVIAQALVIVDTNLASRTGEGSLAVMRFATRLQQFPLGLIGSAVALAFLPVLARSAPATPQALRTATTFKYGVVTAGRSALALMIPVTIIMLVLTTSIVRAVYERGAFDSAATEATSLALFIYAIQLPLTVLDQVFISAYYATRNTRTPVLVGIASGGVYLLTALTLTSTYGLYGLVTANTVQNSFHAILLGVLLWRRIGGLRGRGLWLFTVQVSVAGILAGLLGYAARELFITSSTATGWVALTLPAAVILATYTALLWTFRVPELPALARLLRNWRASA